VVRLKGDVSGRIGCGIEHDIAGKLPIETWGFKNLKPNEMRQQMERKGPRAEQMSGHDAGV